MKKETKDKVVVNKGVYAQGELLIRKVGDMPSGVKPLELEDGNYIIGHSETGHHHVIAPQQGVEVMFMNDFELYVKVAKGVEAKLDHKRDYHTHKPLYLKGGPTGSTFIVRRQWEDSGEDLRKVTD